MIGSKLRSLHTPHIRLAANSLGSVMANGTCVLPSMLFGDRTPTLGRSGMKALPSGLVKKIHK